MDPLLRQARLVQVVSNLLINAARYTPPGGEIRLAATASDVDVVIEVEDNGTGIAPELLPRVFETFVPGARSADRAEGGPCASTDILDTSAHGHP